MSDSIMMLTLMTMEIINVGVCLESRSYKLDLDLQIQSHHSIILLLLLIFTSLFLTYIWQKHSLISFLSFNISSCTNLELYLIKLKSQKVVRWLQCTSLPRHLFFLVLRLRHFISLIIDEGHNLSDAAPRVRIQNVSKIATS